MPKSSSSTRKRVNKPAKPAVLSFARGASITKKFPVPNLIDIQKKSYDWFEKAGIKQLLVDEVSPIYDATGKRFELSFVDYELRKPRYSERECRMRETTYASPLFVTVALSNLKRGGELKEQPLFFGDIPKMTEHGTFIINGAERVVVSQMVRSPGPYFKYQRDPVTKQGVCALKLIPYRGAWLEADVNADGIISVKVDRKRKMTGTTFLQALGWSREDIPELFKDIENGAEFIEKTLKKDSSKVRKQALTEFYKRLRPSEPIITNEGNAIKYVEGIFFDPRKYNLAHVGRYKMNLKIQSTKDWTNDERYRRDLENVGLNADQAIKAQAKDLEKMRKDNESCETYTLTKEDVIALFKMMILIKNGYDIDDDIDHLGNRRVRTVGELIQNQLRVGLVRMERMIVDRMSTQMNPDSTTPAALINNRSIVNTIRSFFGSSQLSQFMDQTNPLSELTHKRRISAMGPGGLSRERAGFDVRDVHYSHYGRICPIETPEGPNIGLLISLGSYAKVNKYGLIETPYRPLRHQIDSNDQDIVGRTVLEDVLDDAGKVVQKDSTVVTKVTFDKVLSKLKVKKVRVKPYLSSEDDLIHMTADVEERYRVAQSTTPVDSKSQLIPDTLEVRSGENFVYESANNVDYIEVSPIQLVSVSTALIPFLEHDDANRALMGSNMQRQAVSLLTPQAPLVGTGMESPIARYSGQVLISDVTGVVTSASATNIVVTDNNDKDHAYAIDKFQRSNQGTCINQRVIVKQGQKVTKGDVMADSYSTDNGELALGQNLLVGFMSWEGYNYEDAIIISQDLVRDDRFTSVHIEKYELESRETQLGDEEITRDIPNVREEHLLNLDEEGVVRLGAWVENSDILVGKISPKGETELTAEEKLLRAIFGEKAHDVKDTSLRLPHGQKGRVINVQVLSDKAKDGLPSGVLKIVRVWVAQARKIHEGDKMAGRHGNKGVVAKILPREDMPYLEDGTHLDILLNPIGVPSRMNLGQLLETHLGWTAYNLNFVSRTPIFESGKIDVIEDYMARTWIVRYSGAIDPHSISKVDYDEEKLTGWLKERGYRYKDIFKEGTKTGGATAACLKIWLEEKMGEKVPSTMTSKAVLKRAKELSVATGEATPISGKMTVYDGRTGEKFAMPVAIGCMYVLKLTHLSEDKMHARSTGPYSLITQQPIGGKAQFGGQRFGEMEVWALQAYSAAYTLQEILTIKSDDIQGRVNAYDAIVSGEYMVQDGLPESFKVLMKELQGLSLQMDLREKSSSDSFDDLIGSFASDDIFEEEDVGEMVEDIDSFASNVAIGGKGVATPVSESAGDVDAADVKDNESIEELKATGISIPSDTDEEESEG